MGVVAAGGAALAALTNCCNILVLVLAVFVLLVVVGAGLLSSATTTTAASFSSFSFSEPSCFCSLMVSVRTDESRDDRSIEFVACVAVAADSTVWLLLLPVTLLVGNPRVNDANDVGVAAAVGAAVPRVRDDKVLAGAAAALLLLFCC